MQHEEMKVRGTPTSEYTLSTLQLFVFILFVCQCVSSYLFRLFTVNTSFSQVTAAKTKKREIINYF